MADVLVIGRDVVGVIAESEGFRYYITECCAASATGTDDGTACRNCYSEVSDALGDVPSQPTKVFGDGIRWEVWKARQEFQRHMSEPVRLPDSYIAIHQRFIAEQRNERMGDMGDEDHR